MPAAAHKNSSAARTARERTERWCITSAAKQKSAVMRPPAAITADVLCRAVEHRGRLRLDVLYPRASKRPAKAQQHVRYHRRSGKTRFSALLFFFLPQLPQNSVRHNQREHHAQEYTRKAPCVRAGGKHASRRAQKQQRRAHRA